MDLLFKMLKFDPAQRITATDVRAPPFAGLAGSWRAPI
jgi:hypothetical protein